MLYDTAIELSKKAKDKSRGKKIANNTYLRVENEIAIIRLHETDIIKISADNSYVLDTGGWNTLTTRDRFNRFCPFRVFTEKNVPYVSLKKGRQELFDGIKIKSEVVLNPRPEQEEKRIVETRKKLEKLITKYIKGFCDSIRLYGLEYPGGGDCWYCSMFPQDNFSTPHIFSHFEENYFVPSLLFNAIKLRGYKNPEFIFEHIKQGKNIRMARQDLRYYFRHYFDELLKSM
jgi:hypothetical protein